MRQSEMDYGNEVGEGLKGEKTTYDEAFSTSLDTYWWTP